MPFLLTFQHSDRSIQGGLTGMIRNLLLLVPPRIVPQDLCKIVISYIYTYSKVTNPTPHPSANAAKEHITMSNDV